MKIEIHNDVVGSAVVNQHELRHKCTVRESAFWEYACLFYIRETLRTVGTVSRGMGNSNWQLEKPCSGSPSPDQAQEVVVMKTYRHAHIPCLLKACPRMGAISQDLCSALAQSVCQ